MINTRNINYRYIYIYIHISISVGPQNNYQICHQIKSRRNVEGRWGCQNVDFEHCQIRNFPFWFWYTCLLFSFFFWKKNVFYPGVFLFDSFRSTWRCWVRSRWIFDEDSEPGNLNTAWNEQQPAQFNATGHITIKRKWPNSIRISSKSTRMKNQKAE